MSRVILWKNVRFYAEARDRIRDRLSALSKNWAPHVKEKRVAFYRAGDIAEIGYVCLQGTDLRLVCVIDNDSRRFFDIPVHDVAWLRTTAPDELPFQHLVVMSFDDVDEESRKIAEAGVPSTRVFRI